MNASLIGQSFLAETRSFAAADAFDKRLGGRGSGLVIGPPTTNVPTVYTSPSGG